MGTSVDVAVVGGGPAGLTAAMAAARRGLDVVLLERGDRLGGMAASLDVAGHRVDLGSHRLHPSAPARVRRLLDDLLGDDLQVRARNGRLRLAGRWVGFPFRPADMLASMPKGVAVRLIRDLVVSRGDVGTARTYAEFVRSGLGATALEHVHGPMAEKLWGESPDRLSAELARRRIGVRDRRSVVRRLARTSRSGGRTFLYPRLGYGEIVERLAESAVAAGAELRCGVGVDGLGAQGGHGDRSVALTTPDGAIEAGRVLWTAPLDALARASGVGAVAPVTHRGVVLVYLVLPTARYSEFDAHYVPDRDVAFARLSEPANYRDGPRPADTTVLCAELPASVGDAAWSAGDDELVALVLAGMERCGLPRPEVVGCRTVRLPRVYPIVPAGGEAARRATLAAADSLPGVTVLGRQGLLVADNLHHVVDMALSAVDCVGADGAWDAARWAAERERFDRFVVDD